MKKILKNIKNVFLPQKANNSQKIQTFTYFIPSPPKRNAGYREKQFDREFFDFINKGYEIVSINTQQCSDQRQPGMWFICTVRSTSQLTQELSFEDELGPILQDENLTHELIPEHQIENDELGRNLIK